MKILFLDETTHLKTLEDLQHRGRGGMVSSLRILPDVLSQLGFECFVLSDIEQGGITDAGTTWYTKGQMTDAEKQREYDFLVYNRQVCDGFSEIKTRRRILWTHDLPHHGFIPDTRILKVIDAVVFMSHYAEAVWRTYYQAIGSSFLIPNGVDKDLFYPREKIEGYLIFCSAPNRGLGKLPLIYRTLKEKVSTPVYMRAYSNMGALHPWEKETGKGDGFFKVDGFDDTYQECLDAGIDLRDPVPQHELAEELGKASLMILPTEYPEICSNTILQALASGVPVITTGNMGSAGEWVSHGYNGYLTRFQPCDYWVCYLEMTRFAIDLFKHSRTHQKLIRNAPRTRGLFTWQKIGRMWADMLGALK